jgi:hypothetical protein
MNKMLFLFVVGCLMASHYFFPYLIEARDKRAFDRCLEQLGGHSDANCEECYMIVYGKEVEDVY